MIEGNKKIKDEKEYRDTLLDSSSSLKTFSLDRKKYYRVYIENSGDSEDDDTKAIVTGKIVECLLLEPHLFDNKFYLSAISKAPTGKMLDFVNALVKLTFESSDEQDNVTRSFEDMATEARTIAEFDWSLKVILDKFVGREPEIYYNEIRRVRANNLTVVTAQDVTNAERIVEELKTNFVTKDIVNLVDSSRWTVKNQFQVEGFSVDGHLFKSMIDKVIIDHDKKTIQVYDLKCVWNVEGFYSDYYLYRRAYLQGYIYWCAIADLATDKEHEWYRYEVLPPAFIVCDSINYFNPLIYKMTNDDLNEAYEGFEYKGKKYPGVKEIIENLIWSLDNNIWNISRENYLKNGIVNINENDAF